jgi:hypothetical protein
MRPGYRSCSSLSISSMSLPLRPEVQALVREVDASAAE